MNSNNCDHCDFCHEDCHNVSYRIDNKGQICGHCVEGEDGKYCDGCGLVIMEEEDYINEEYFEHPDEELQYLCECCYEKNKRSSFERSLSKYCIPTEEGKNKIIEALLECCYEKKQKN